MGLEVAKALSRRGGWSIHCLDIKGSDAVQQVENATFHKANVLDYDSLASTFQQIFDNEGRIDFVFANAGIVERFNFYGSHPAGKPPPPPDQTVIDINLKSVINTTWLAQHYLGHSTASENKNLIMTASCGGFYRCQASPSYTAAKHGVVGFMRSIAPNFYKKSGIRVNAICPGTVKTNLLEAAAWSNFPDELFVPIEKVSEAVLMLIDGHEHGGKAPVNGSAVDEKAHGVNGAGIHGSNEGEKFYGKAVELSGTNHYFRDQPPFCDENMARCMGFTDIDNF